MIVKGGKKVSTIALCAGVVATGQIQAAAAIGEGELKFVIGPTK